MDNADHTKQKIEEILNFLDAKEDRYRTVLRIVAVAFIVLGLVIGLVSDYIGSCIFLAFFFVGISYGVFRVALLFAERHARVRYIQAYAGPEDRRIADSILAEVNRRHLVTLRRFRRKLGVIIPRFRCSTCNSSVEVKHMGQVVQCRHCEAKLFVPVSPCCPECGNRITRIITPEEQVPPVKDDAKGKTAGALMYGPAGILAGSIMDGIRKSSKKATREAQVAHSTHLYYCEKCKAKWATKLWPAQNDRRPT